MLMNLINQKIRDKHLWNKNLILQGDMNLYEEDEDVVNLITDYGFK